MSLLPQLIKKRILIAFGHAVKDKEPYQIQDGMEEVEVEEWESVGLCIHKRDDEIGMGKWRITHVGSGRSILRHITDRDETITYLMIIYYWRSIERYRIDWTNTDEQLKKLHYREEIVEMLRGLQKQINGEVR